MLFTNSKKVNRAKFFCIEYKKDILFPLTHTDPLHFHTWELTPQPPPSPSYPKCANPPPSLASRRHRPRRFSSSSYFSPNLRRTFQKPSIAGWWRTVQLYTDQTGSNISKSVRLGQEKNDRFYSHGKSLTRLSVQSVIKSAITARTKPLPINPRSGLYLLLTSEDVYVQDFCTSVCGFHYFTFPSLVGYTLPYAWVGNSAKLCSGQCAYPFAVPAFIPNRKPFKSPNGDVGVDGMISVIAHELAELATNPLANAWYAGQDPSFPVEIADLCEGIYGTGGGGSYTGQVMDAQDGATYNMNGIRRRFLVQWVWNHILNYCTGPNALDQ
ncbi:hypothetical protein K1719_024585 [Acacia pycnantha]|nr:hypothetical protein K1719_024585 [Acacia pycnantha]